MMRSTAVKKKPIVTPLKATAVAHYRQRGEALLRHLRANPSLVAGLEVNTLRYEYGRFNAVQLRLRATVRSQPSALAREAAAAARSVDAVRKILIAEADRRGVSIG
jgi:hypothetical protein